MGLKKKKEFIGKIILTFYGFVLGFIIFSSIVGILSRKKILEKSDFYGTYIVDRNFFKGKQTDWQYNNFRFEIKENDSIYFHETNGEKITKTLRGKIYTTNNYNSARLKVKMGKNTHHILKTNPTIYRQAWGFFLVFESSKFYNMYFRKGKWKKIE